jgi:molybdopterin molybdotransferase
MRSVDEHLADILSRVGALSEMDLHLWTRTAASSRTTSSPPAPLPGFDNSAMDGYAVRVGRTSPARRRSTLRSCRSSATSRRAAARCKSIGAGVTARIMTGAPIPPGADAVVPVEWTDGGVHQVRIGNAPPVGAFIRRAGEDVRPGDTVLPSGTLLGSAQVGLLAAIGRRSARVRPKPRVVIISTGTELVEIGSELGPGQLIDSNSYAITAAVREAGAIAYRVGIVPDEPRKLQSSIEDHLIQADMVVTSGGVSVGAYDVVKQVLAYLGDVQFQSVAMQPGMPQAFGTIGPDQVPIFGLPGNPVSALVSFEVFVRPALRRMLGAEPLGRPQVSAVLTQPIRSPAGKRQFLRVRVGAQRRPVGRRADRRPGLAHDGGPGRCQRARRHTRVGDRRRSRLAADHLAARTARPVSGELTHLDSTGAARMVDVTGKDVTARTASRPAGCVCRRRSCAC